MSLLTRCITATALVCRLMAAEQQPTRPTEPKELSEKEKEDLDAGIPITSELVRKTCSPCHKADDKQRLIAHIVAADHARRAGKKPSNA